MQWDDVRILVALFRAPRLADAASTLGLDASTLSRRLARLEDEVGGRLFARTRDGLRPTAAAERLRPFAEAMAADAAGLLHSVRAGERRASGTVRLATTEVLSRMLVSQGLLDVRRQHPDLVVEILGDNHALDLTRDEADLALRLSALRQPSLRARCVAKTGVGLFAAPEYLRARGRPRGVAGLRGHDVLLPASELARLPEVRWLASRPGVRVALRSNSMGALVAAAVAGHGILPLPLGWGDGERGLERVLVLDAIPERKIWLVTHEAAAGRPGVVVVSEQIVAILERLFGAA